MSQILQKLYLQYTKNQAIKKLILCELTCAVYLDYVVPFIFFWFSQILLNPTVKNSTCRRHWISLRVGIVATLLYTLYFICYTLYFILLCYTSYLILYNIHFIITTLYFKINTILYELRWLVYSEYIVFHMLPFELRCAVYKVIFNSYSVGTWY